MDEETSSTPTGQPSAENPPVIVEVPTTPVVTATTPEQIQAAVAEAVDARTQELREQIATREAVESFTAELSELRGSIAGMSERISNLETLLQTLIETLTPEGEQEPQNPETDNLIRVDSPRGSKFQPLRLL